MIIGQGIAGSLLGWQAEKVGLSIDIYDEGALESSSAASSGIINPLTGPKYVKSWMIETFMPIARQVYRNIEVEIGQQFMSDIPIWRYIKDIKAENVWDTRSIDPSYERYIGKGGDKAELSDIWPDAHRFGIVSGGFKIEVPIILAALRKKWLSSGTLREEGFVESDLFMAEDGSYQYKETGYKHVILACGYKGTSSKLFATAEYAPFKGEVLICEIDGLPKDRIIKYGKFIMPRLDGTFWVGSTIDHNTVDLVPNKEKAKILITFLDEVVRKPYKVIDHIAGIRPATSYRRPLIGEHRKHKGLYLFNGLGTKGISMTPYFSQQMIEAIASGSTFEETKAFQSAFQV